MHRVYKCYVVHVLSLLLVCACLLRDAFPIQGSAFLSLCVKYIFLLSKNHHTIAMAGSMANVVVCQMVTFCYVELLESFYTHKN